MAKPETQSVPLRVYRSLDLLVVAAPMAGLGPEDITVEIKEDARLILHGHLADVPRFATVEALGPNKELLVDEWIMSPYHRELALSVPVDGQTATVTYGNGVLVVALPITDRIRAACLRLEALGPTRGERAGRVEHSQMHVGEPSRPSGS